MKSSNIYQAFKVRAILFFSVLLGTSSLQSQNGASLTKQEINEFRLYSQKVLDILPNENAINASKSFSKAEKQQLLKIRKAFKEGSQVKDNMTKSKFSSLDKEIADAEDFLFNPGTDSEGGVGNKSQLMEILCPLCPDPLVKTCGDGCFDKLKRDRSSCAGTQECKRKATQVFLECMRGCNRQ